MDIIHIRLLGEQLCDQIGAAFDAERVYGVWAFPANRWARLCEDCGDRYAKMNGDRIVRRRQTARQ